MVLRGWALAKSSAPDEGIPQIRTMIDLWRSFGSELCVPYFYALLGDACLEAGRVDDGIEAVNAGLEIAERTEDRWYEAELLRLGGALRLRRGDAADEVAQRFTKAMDVARGQGARLFELRAAVALARLDGSPASRETVSALCAAFDDGLDVPDLITTRAVAGAS